MSPVGPNWVGPGVFGAGAGGGTAPGKTTHFAVIAGTTVGSGTTKTLATFTVGAHETWQLTAEVQILGTTSAGIFGLYLCTVGGVTPPTPASTVTAHAWNASATQYLVCIASAIVAPTSSTTYYVQGRAASHSIKVLSSGSGPFGGTSLGTKWSHLLGVRLA